MIEPWLEVGYQLFGMIVLVAYRDKIRRAWNGLWYGGQSLKDLKCHTYVLGTIGSGKSTFVYNRFLQVIQGHGAVIISTHGLKDLLQYIPEEAASRVKLISPARERSLGVNLLQRYTWDDTERLQIADSLVSLLKRLDSSMGGNMEELIYQGCLAVLEVAEPTREQRTIYQVYRFLVDDEERADVLARVDSQTIRDTFGQYRQDSMDAAIRRMRRMLGNPILVSTLARLDGLDLMQVVRDGQILVCDLDQAELGVTASESIAEIIMSQMYLISLTRNERMPYYFGFFDEFQTYSNTFINKFVEEGRKRNFPIMLAHQRRGQLTKNQQEAVNLCGTWYIFRVTVEDAREVAKGFPSIKANKGKMEHWERLNRQPLYHLYYREQLGRTIVYGHRHTRRLPKPVSNEQAIWEANSQEPTRREVVAQVMGKGGEREAWSSIVQSAVSWSSWDYSDVPPSDR